VTSAMVADGTLVNADISATAAIDKTKISGTAITAADTGTVTSTMVADGTLVNADINASAAIAGTKISPDFGSQNTTTTGTSTAASFIPTSSTVPSNGVYLPSANNVAISTNGTGRLFVDASAGNVDFKSPTNQNSTLRLYPNGTAVYTGVQLFNAAGSQAAQLLSASGSEVYLDSGGSGSINYRASGTGTHVWFTNGTQKATIDSSGRLGLGTSSPSELLHINGGKALFEASTPQITLKRAGATYQSDIRFMTGSTAKWGIGQALAVTNESFEIYDYGAGATRFLIDTSGRVGIGNTFPSSFDGFANQLVVGSGSGNNGITIYAGSSNGSSISFADGTGASSYSGYIYYDHSVDRLSFYVNYGGSPSARMVIDSSGRVLVGASSGNAKLEVSINPGTSGPTSGTTPQGIAISYNDNDGAYGGLWFSNTFGGEQGISGIAGTRTSGYSTDLRFYTNNTSSARAFTERMRIAANGQRSSVLASGSTLYNAYDCRAWVNFNGTGTVAIRESGNVSSITDNGIGDYTVNFTNAMADANYGTNVTCNSSGATNKARCQTIRDLGTTSTVRVNIWNPATASDQDPEVVNVAVFR